MGTSVDHDDTGTAATVRIQGDLDVRHASAFYDQVRSLLGRDGLRTIVVDFAQAARLDSAGIAAVSLAASESDSAGIHLEARNLQPAHRAALEMMTAAGAGDDASGPAHPGLFERIGGTAFGAWEQLAALAELIVDSVTIAALALVRRQRLPRGAVVEQSVVTGVDALFIVTLLSFLLGLIMAFQSAYHLSQFGANIYVADLVGLSMAREFGPMMTGIMLAGRSGSAIAAELATMTVQEETDALRTMGINPVRFLVVPRLIALTIVEPALTLIADFVGILGGFLIATSLLGLSMSAYVDETLHAVSMGDISYGLIKSVVFAWIIGITGCYTGLQIRGGASSVGKATTRAVVTSIFLIIVADSAFATVTTLLHYA